MRRRGLFFFCPNYPTFCPPRLVSHLKENITEARTKKLGSSASAEGGGRKEDGGAWGIFFFFSSTPSCSTGNRRWRERGERKLSQELGSRAPPGWEGGEKLGGFPLPSSVWKKSLTLYFLFMNLLAPFIYVLENKNQVCQMLCCNLAALDCIRMNAVWLPSRTVWNWNATLQFRKRKLHPNKNRLCSKTCGIDNISTHCNRKEPIKCFLHIYSEISPWQMPLYRYVHVYKWERSHPKEKSVWGGTDPTPKRNLVKKKRSDRSWLISTDPTPEKTLVERIAVKRKPIFFLNQWSVNWSPPQHQQQLPQF